LERNKVLCIFKYLTIKYIHLQNLISMTDKITEIFFYADEFCKEYCKVMEGHVLVDETSKKKQTM